MKNSYVFAVKMSPFLLTACGVTNSKVVEPVRPNIVLVLADDMGYSDLVCYGGELNTPNIDRLAQNGVRYTQFYNAARSCPSRACLLTGLTPHQAGVGHMVEDRGYPGYRGQIAQNTVTLAEMLKQAGYQTAMAGKWHVTNNIDPKGSKESWPLQRGFDYYYGTLSGHGSYYDPKALFDGNKPIRATGDFYYTEAITDKVKSYLQKFSEKNDPFFIYAAYTAPHYPLHARKEFIDKQKGKFDQGWDSLRQQRFERMKIKGIIPQNTVLSPRDCQCPDWVTVKNKEWELNRMEVYAAMVEQMDLGVGRIVNELKRLNKLENTIIIFLSDNGASNEGHLNNIVERLGKEWKASMIPETTRSGEKVISGDIPGMKLGGPATYGSYGAPWAHLCTTPFKRYKSWMHEGGICAPFIVSWPEKIKDAGSIRKGVFSLIDIMPTFIELAQGEYPDSIRGLKTEKIEGKSMVQSFINGSFDANRTLYWEHEGNRAIRQGKWKLVSEYPGDWSTLRLYPEHSNWELYNLDVDRAETNNLSRKCLNRVKKIK